MKKPTAKWLEPTSKFSAFWSRLKLADLRTAGLLLIAVYVLVVLWTWSQQQKFWLPNFEPWAITRAATEALHGFLPIAILAMELYVLASMAHESKERKHTIESFEELALKERRTEYLHALAKSIRAVKKDAFFTSSSMETSTVSDGQKLIVRAAVTRKEDGEYTHRGLIAKRQEALPGAIELAIRTDIKLKFCDAVTMSRLRFFVQDNEHCVLGIADGDQDLGNQKKTTNSVKVSSTMLAESLRATFDGMWNSSTELGEYLDEVIGHRAPHASAENIRGWFESVDATPAELDIALKKHSTSYAALSKEAENPTTPK